MEKQGEQTIQLSASYLSALAACPERYVIKALVGQGGMGMVFCAFDTQLNRDVAIKVLLFDGAGNPEAQERFLREAKALAVLDHPNIVRIFSSGLNAQGNPYNVMEFLEGEPLSLELSRGPLDSQRFFELMSQVLAGLEHAHEQQIMHRDLKPGNIMHCRLSDGTESYKIIDFGIARIDLTPEQAGKALTRTNAILGSPLYMSPEQCRGERVDYASDVYSLGCIMYECISGKPPCKGETAFETMYKHMTETPASLALETDSPQSKQLSALISRCLEKKAEDRPQVSAIAGEIKLIFAVDPDKIDLFKSSEGLGKSNYLRFAGVLIAVCVMAIGVAVWTFSQNRKLVSVPVKIDIRQAPVAREIERWQARIAKWKDKAEAINSPGQRDRYLSDLFSLGRFQLASSLKKDNADAETTYTGALKLCDSAGGVVPRRRAACFALRAKSKWKQGKFQDSDADFAEAINLVRNRENEQSIWHDILLERAILEIHTRKYAEALSDFEIVLKSNKIALFNVFQNLDPPGDSRAAMICNVAAELRKMEAQSDAEAVEMLRLSNRLARTLSDISTRHKETLEQLRFSGSLLPEVHANEQLKAETRSLLKEF